MYSFCQLVYVIYVMLIIIYGMFNWWYVHLTLAIKKGANDADLSKVFYLYICLFCKRVLDNLKDYAVRALVNAIDHLGTVAYKLSDILEQQTLDISSTELKVKCVNQVTVNLVSLEKVLLSINR